MNFLKRSQELSFLPIDFQLYDYLTLDENLIFVCKMRNLTPNEKEIENVFLDYDLQAYRYQQLASLSTGLKQKFYFLIAIIHNPKILILDEPFTGLDPKQIIYFKER
jgi:ABC-2 type transport system ATP-binding protein